MTSPAAQQEPCPCGAAHSVDAATAAAIREVQASGGRVQIDDQGKHLIFRPAPSAAGSDSADERRSHQKLSDDATAVYEAERRRRQLLTEQGGLEGEASRVLHLSHKADHAAGIRR